MSTNASPSQYVDVTVTVQTVKEISRAFVTLDTKGNTASTTLTNVLPCRAKTTERARIVKGISSVAVINIGLGHSVIRTLMSAGTILAKIRERVKICREITRVLVVNFGQEDIVKNI